jgi:hypothetical protein
MLSPWTFVIEFLSKLVSKSRLGYLQGGLLVVLVVVRVQIGFAWLDRALRIGLYGRVNDRQRPGRRLQAASRVGWALSAR